MKATLSAAVLLITFATAIWIDNQASINDRAAAALENALKSSETVFSQK